MGSKQKSKATVARTTVRDRAMAEFSNSYEDFANVVRPSDGKNYYRILPPKSLEPVHDSFYISREQHIYNKRPVFCPKTLSKRAACAICEEYEETKKVDEEAAGFLRPRPVYFFNVLVIDPKAKSLSKEVEILQLPKSAAKRIVLDLFMDDDEGGECWGEDFGRKGVAYDILVFKEGKGLGTRYTVQPTFKFCKLATPGSVLKVINDLEAMPQFAVSSSDEVETLVNGAGGGAASRVVSSKKGKSKAEAEDDEDEDEDDEDLDDDDDEDEEELDADNDEDDEDEDDDEDDDDDEESDDEDDDDEDEDEDDDDDEEDDDDEDDDDDDDDEEDKKPAKTAKPSKKVTKKKATKSTPKGKTDKKALANMLKGGKRKSA